jgi:hypothetical protein
MGYRGQSGSRRSAGEKFSKSSHDKVKSKNPKAKSGTKYAPEDVPGLTAEEIAEKTLASLERLGSQTFALSPFSQYFDDWLLNLRQVVSEFESGPAVSADETFVKDRSQIFGDVEGELAKRRLKETELEAAAKALSENNHLLVEIDVSYATQTKDLAGKRNTEIGKLTKIVHDLEEELAVIEQTKTGFLNPFAKRAKGQKRVEATQKLDVAKKELELSTQNFGVEQEKLHDEYEKKKQSTMQMVQNLEKEIVNIETDASLEIRQTAANALSNAVKALLQRKTASPQ